MTAKLPRNVTNKMCETEVSAALLTPRSTSTVGWMVCVNNTVAMEETNLTITVLRYHMESMFLFRFVCLWQFPLSNIKYLCNSVCKLECVPVCLSRGPCAVCGGVRE